MSNCIQQLNSIDWIEFEESSNDLIYSNLTRLIPHSDPGSSEGMNQTRPPKGSSGAKRIITASKRSSGTFHFNSLLFLIFLHFFSFYSFPPFPRTPIIFATFFFFFLIFVSFYSHFFLNIFLCSQWRWWERWSRHSVALCCWSRIFLQQDRRREVPGWFGCNKENDKFGRLSYYKSYWKR